MRRARALAYVVNPLIIERHYSVRRNFPVIDRGFIATTRASKSTSCLMNAGAIGIVCVYTRSRIVVLNGNCRAVARRSPVNSTNRIVRTIDLKVLSGEESRETRKMINENCGNDPRDIARRLVRLVLAV